MRFLCVLTALCLSGCAYLLPEEMKTADEASYIIMVQARRSESLTIEQVNEDLLPRLEKLSRQRIKLYKHLEEIDATLNITEDEKRGVE